MDTLLPKLLLTPALITFATLLGRRFGQSIAGWLIAFPFTSAPVSFFLATDHGLAFAAAAARGSMLSVIAVCAYAWTFSRVRRGWVVALVCATIAYLIAVFALRLVDLDPAYVIVLVGAVVTLVSRLRPRPAAVAPAAAPPAWDLPARVVIATVLVLTITFV